MNDQANQWRERVDAADWAGVAAELSDHGGALLPPLLDPGETKRIQDLYEDGSLFRSTVDMARHRFGQGEYRYFKTPYPEPVERLKQALYPRLLPIARDWWAKLGDDPPPRARIRVHDGGKAGSFGSGMVCGPGTARGIGDSLGTAAHAGPRFPRCVLAAGFCQSAVRHALSRPDPHLAETGGCKTGAEQNGGA